MEENGFFGLRFSFLMLCFALVTSQRDDFLCVRIPSKKTRGRNNDGNNGVMCRMDEKKVNYVAITKSRMSKMSCEPNNIVIYCKLSAGKKKKPVCCQLQTE